MKRFAIFAILGPPSAAAVFYAFLLPVASLLEGVWIEISASASQLPSLFLMTAFSALVVGVFDWVAEKIEIPFRPVACAIAGWFLATLALRDVLALPDIPGWFVVIGLLGGIPAFLCSWLALRLDKKKIASA